MNDAPQSRGQWTSASNAAADALCCWRHTMQKGCPESESKDSDFGERIHAALAKDDPAGLTPAEADVYESCVKIREKKLAEFFGSPAHVFKFTEQRYWTVFNGDTWEIKHSGQPDRVYRLSNRLFILDYKTLPGDQPDSSENAQLRDLAVLTWIHFIGVTEVGVCLIQPFVTHSPTICLYSESDLERANREMTDRVLRSNNPQGEPTPGTTQCKFCRAKSKCVQYQRWASAGLPVVKTLVDVPRESWTPEQRREFADKFDIAQKWLNDSWAFLEAGATKDPTFVPGYGWKDGAIRRTQQTHCLKLAQGVTAQQVFDRLAAKGMTLECFLTCVGVINAEIGAWMQSKTKLTGLALDKAIDDLYSGLVTTTRNKPSLKRIKDK